eukprot:5879200-Pyramimonas_sp.AAC.1
MSTSPDTHDLRCPHLRRASQEHERMATAAPFAAPEGVARSQMDPRDPHLRRVSKEPTRVATFA